jgi:disulfide oxidoreductase YuzD
MLEIIGKKFDNKTQKYIILSFGLYKTEEHAKEITEKLRQKEYLKEYNFLTREQKEFWEE